MTAPLIETKGVSKHYGVFCALDDVSVAVRDGEFVSVVGPNGAGKTTLVNVLTGLLGADQGRGIFQGHKHYRCRPGRAGQARHGADVPARTDFSTTHRRGDDCCCRGLAAGQAMAAVLCCVRRCSRQCRASRKLPASSGWSAGWTVLSRLLSQGEKKLLDVASAFALNPEVILLDEPTSGVSTAEKHGLMQTLISAAKTAGVKAIILVEHDMDLVAAYSHRIIALSEGKVLADLPPEPFFADPVIIETVVGKRRGH